MRYDTDNLDPPRSPTAPVKNSCVPEEKATFEFV